MVLAAQEDKKEMTTLEFMDRELKRCKINLAKQEARNAPTGDMENIKIKIAHYEKVCEVLRKESV